MDWACDWLMTAERSDHGLGYFEDLGKKAGHELDGVGSVGRGLRVGRFRPRDDERLTWSYIILIMGSRSSSKSLKEV